MSPQEARRPPRAPEFVVVGRIVRPWGIRGEVKVRVETDFPERFRPGQRFYLLGRPYTCLSARFHQGFVLLKLEGVDTRDDAEALRGLALEVPASELPDLPPDTYYHFQLQGLRVETTRGEDLGQVVEVFSTGSNEVLVVEGPRGQVLIPLIADVVRQVDLEEERIRVEPIPGLLP